MYYVVVVEIRRVQEYAGKFKKNLPLLFVGIFVG